MVFKFEDPHFCYSGYLTFLDHLLLVTDAGHDAVHVVDVAGQVHTGYVAAPGTIAGPRGVAARGSLVAVSAWKRPHSGDHVLYLFEGSGNRWARVRVLCGGFGGPSGVGFTLARPYGLRFSADGMVLAVANDGNGRVSLFRVGSGSFVRHVATGLQWPRDVEECSDGWLVACVGSDTVELVGVGVGRRCALGQRGIEDGKLLGPSALALAPGVGLVVRELGNKGRGQVFA
jgi:hypothetical protein